MKEKKTAKRKFLNILFWIFIAIFALCVISLGVYFLEGLLSNDVVEPQNDNTSSVQSEAPPLRKNPIDFEELQKINTDIYAYIKIPGTVIDYPVVQATNEDDDFYLHRGLDKKYKFAGSIYSEKKNRKNFTDRNTVLYGHNMLNGTMFQNLHKFRNAEFFEKNQYIYIYTPGHILTYKIIAAYKYDNRHLLNTINYSDNTVFKDYLSYIQNPTSMMVNKREVELDLKSKILTLSTCIGDEKEHRYLVQGVLINDERTK